MTDRKKYQKGWYQANKERLTKKRHARIAAERAEAGVQVRVYVRSGAATRRDYDIRRKYGITEEQRDKLAAAQGGKCAICESDAELHVDHCHATNKVRGLLCRECNIGLGKFKDDLDLLERAKKYVQPTSNPS